uniref:Uncharacterized protein n=1 Tax=Gasterosteus aculeatus TaxID=69293 RepID=G3Q4V3_GASAC
MAFALSEEQFRCVICLDIFHNPVSTPCGHNFCRGCIKRYWDTRHKSECPLCKEVFKIRPELRINVGLKDITEQFKNSKTDEVPCDICQEKSVMAVKSCFVCQLSYCEIHLTPHLRDPVLTMHSLADPGTFVTSHLCKSHKKVLDRFCKRDQTPICVECREFDHKHHETISITKESKMVRIQMKTVEAEFRDMIKTRHSKYKEINSSVEISEENQASLIDEIEKKQGAAHRKDEALLQELGLEINELQRRRSELQHLESSDDPLHLLQVRAAARPGATQRGPQVQPSGHMGVVRRAFTKLVDVFQELENKLAAEEISDFYQYAVDVTLDPVTASGWLSLSADGKQVSLSPQLKKPSPPEDWRRFDSCVSILGKQCFTSGRHYWVVQVGDKTDWDLGVARESINRKGAITVRPDSGYWAICRRKGGSLNVCAGPSFPLRLQETPQKVGVFLDYEEGSVSFYDAEAKSHIYTYSGCEFPEPVYPYLNPCLHDNGRNTAPLVICPVEFNH